MLSLVILGGFVFTVFVWARLMPASHGAPHVGQQAPDFTLTDTNGRSVSLAELLSSSVYAIPETSVESKALPKGVLLIFYRGYW